MSKSYSTLRDEVESLLQDTANATFSTTELDLIIPDVLREVSRYEPYVVRESFTTESRTGSVSATTAGKLIDTGKSQFVAADVGKVVYNTTDKTWAIIKTYNSTSSVDLSKNIMTIGENYKIYNKGCIGSKQIDISDITDYLGVESVEYPVGTNRDWFVSGDTLELLIDDDPSTTDTEVYVYFNKYHRVSQLTDFLGAVNLLAGYDEGDTEMILDALQDSGTIEEGQEFTIANVRGLYRVTAAATITGNDATIDFFPGLESDVADDTVVTFKASTLTPNLEPLVVSLSAARAEISKSSYNIDRVNTGGPGVWQSRLAHGERLRDETLAKLRRLHPFRVSQQHSRS